MLVARGAALIDADAIARSLTVPSGAAMVQIQAQFGARAIDALGGLHRDYMRQLTFTDATARQQLEAIIHPLVGQGVTQQADAAAAAGHRCIIMDIPLLVESGRWRHQVDHVLVVDCLEVTQIERVMTRNGLAREMVEKIMTAQATRSQRLAAADSCIYNEGLTLAALELQVRELAQRFGL